MLERSRRRFLQGSLAVAGLSLVPACGLVALPGQRPTSPRRIGFLESGANPNAFAPFREGLRDLGYVEGQSILIEYRSAEGNPERLAPLATALVDSRIDVIVAREPGSVLAASRVTSTIPIVSAGGDVVASRLVANIARPEGNITGVTTNVVETVGKWLELLKESVPSLSHLAVVWDPGSVSNQASMQAAQRGAQVLQLRVAAYDLRNVEQLPAVLASASGDGADGLMLLSTTALGPGNDPRVGSAVLKARLPAVAEGRDFAANGGLLAHGTIPGVLARRSASYVDKLLKGAKPGDLPIELPTEFSVVVNLKTAQELGISIPQSALARATEVVQ